MSVKIVFDRFIGLVFCVVVAFICSGSISSQAKKEPEYPAAARSLLDAIIKSDRAAIERSLGSDFAPEAYNRRTRTEIKASIDEVITNSGGIDVEVFNVEPFVVQLRLTTKNAIRDFRSVTGRRTMYFEANIAPNGTANAGKIVDLTLLAMPPVTLDADMKFDGVPANDRTATAALKAKLTAFAARDLFSGTIVLAKGDRVMWQAAFGDAEKNHGAKNTLHSRFHMASMTKLFTAVAIGQLVEAGRLKFESRLIDVWPDYPNRAVAEKITIDQLLSHTSGLGEGLTAQIQKADSPYRTLETAIAVNSMTPLQFEPGKNWGYSNLGFMVLGRVIEIVSGDSYHDYVRKHILDPLDMTETGDVDITSVVPDLAVGYSRQADDPLGLRERHSNWPLILGFRGTSAGGYYSTALDTLKFMRGLRTYKLLSRQTTEAVTTGKYRLSPTSQYAYGGWDRTLNGRSVRGNGGGGLGYGINTEANTIWTAGGETSDWTLVILSNYDPPVTQDFSRSALRYLASAGTAAK